MRNEFNETDKRILHESSSLIQSFTDFGLEVWVKQLTKGDEDSHDLPSNLLFRQILEAGDGIFELTKVGCINACKPLLRMAFDCYFQMAFLLEGDKDKKGLHFLYHYYRKKLQSLENTLHPEKASSLFKKLQYDSLMNDFVLSEHDKELALADYNTLENATNSEKFREVKKEYGNKVKKTWYEFFIGNPKIEDLAKSLSRAAMYEISFRQLSSFIHGEDIIHSNIAFQDKVPVGIKNLRDASDLKNVIANSIIVLRKSILLFIEAKMNSDQELMLKLKSIDDLRRAKH